MNDKQLLIGNYPRGGKTIGLHHIGNRWSLNTDIIKGTNICEEGIPHTNRSIVNRLNRYERELKKAHEETFWIKSTIKEAVLSERTDLGSSVLRNLAENLGIGEDI